MSPHRFAAAFRDFASVDTEAGVVRGVAVITVGEASGHGLSVDMTTLAQLKECAETYQGGLKVKISTQKGHQGDFAEIVGFLNNFRFSEAGDKLLADLNLLQNSPYRAQVLEIAQRIPDAVGLSVAFRGKDETRDGRSFARCTEIYSADLVGDPAANPTGLFSETISGHAPDSQTQPSTKMDESKIKEIVEASVKAGLDQFSARLSKLETSAAPSKEEAEKDFSAKLEQAAEAGAGKALKLFAEKFGTPPAAASTATDTATANKPAVKKFEELVREHPEYNTRRAFAIQDSVTKHSKEYAEYNSRVNSGEVIMF